MKIERLPTEALQLLKAPSVEVSDTGDNSNQDTDTNDDASDDQGISDS